MTRLDTMDGGTYIHWIHNETKTRHYQYVLMYIYIYNGYKWKTGVEQTKLNNRYMATQEDLWALGYVECMSLIFDLLIYTETYMDGYIEQARRLAYPKLWNMVGHCTGFILFTGEPEQIYGYLDTEEARGKQEEIWGWRWVDYLKFVGANIH